jgi:hypothetical protein
MTHFMTWNYTGTGNVKIELMKGGVLNRVIALSTENEGVYYWTIPLDQTVGSDFKIKISAVSNSLITDSSDDYFTIHEPGTLTVTSPNGGEKWLAGSTHTIMWSTTGYTGSYVNIKVFKGGFYTTNVLLGTSNDGVHSWVIPSWMTPGTDYKIEISCPLIDFSDMSDGNFEVAAGILTVTRPNGGEEWARNSDYEITWSSSGIVGTNVKIELLKYGTLDSTVIGSTPNDGSYVWLVEDWKSLRTDYSIRITSLDDLSITDSSDGYFSIIGIIVIDPDGGDYWERGMAHAITWTSLGNVGSNVKIELLNNGVPEVLASSVANNGFYYWFIPYDQEIGYQYKIRITSVLYSWISGTCNSNFDVVPNPVNVISPNGGENWVRGSSHTITWSEDASSALVNIYLYKGGVFYSNIVLGTADDGSYDWVIPSSHEGGTDYSVKIESTTATQWSDFSDGYFAISGLTVTSPNGRESYPTGSRQTITWTKVGVTGSYVKIELLLDGKLVWVIDSNAANTGSYNVDIPDDNNLVGTLYKIRITSTTYPEITDVSNANFQIT